MTNERDLVKRYVALWNEADAGRRRATIEALFTAGATHVLEPPQEIRTIAASVGFVDQTLAAAGHDALETRVEIAHREFVAPGTYSFRARDNVARLGDVVKFGWEMVTTADRAVAAIGTEFVVLAPDGRIERDYQFIES